MTSFFKRKSVIAYGNQLFYDISRHNGLLMILPNLGFWEKKQFVIALSFMHHKMHNADILLESFDCFSNLTQFLLFFD